jgi:hypothetical protein
MKQTEEQIRERFAKADRMNCRDIADLFEEIDALRQKCAELAAALKSLINSIAGGLDYEEKWGKISHEHWMAAFESFACSPDPEIMFNAVSILKGTGQAILRERDAQVERETLARVMRRKPSSLLTPGYAMALRDWSDEIDREFAPNVCSDPSAPIVPCITCGKPVHTCERTTAVGNDYCCPVHPDGVELSDGRWICSEECEPKGESDGPSRT